MVGMLKSLVGSKSLTYEDMESVLEKMKDHLIGKDWLTQLAPYKMSEWTAGHLFLFSVVL